MQQKLAFYVIVQIRDRGLYRDFKYEEFVILVLEIPVKSSVELLIKVLCRAVVVELTSQIINYAIQITSTLKNFKLLVR